MFSWHQGAENVQRKHYYNPSSLKIDSKQDASNSDSDIKTHWAVPCFPIVASVSCSYQEVALDTVAAVSKINTLCFQRWSSGNVGCNELLFEPQQTFSIILNQSTWFPFSSTVVSYFHPQPPLWIFLYFRMILCKAERRLCVKLPGDHQFLKYSNQKQLCHIQSHFNHFLDCYDAQQVLNCCHVTGWLAICINKTIS